MLLKRNSVLKRNEFINVDDLHGIHAELKLKNDVTITVEVNKIEGEIYYGTDSNGEEYEFSYEHIFCLSDYDKKEMWIEEK